MRRRPVGSADEVLIRGLFAEHGAALLAYAARLSGDRAAGEEVARETLLRAWSDPRMTVDVGAARAHLFAVVRQVVAERRDGAVRPDLTVDSSAVLSAVRTLPPEQREVLHAVFFQGRDVASTAADLGVPEATVKARTSHALRRLRDAVGRPSPSAVPAVPPPSAESAPAADLAAASPPVSGGPPLACEPSPAPGSAVPSLPSAAPPSSGASSAAAPSSSSAPASAGVSPSSGPPSPTTPSATSAAGSSSAGGGEAAG